MTPREQKGLQIATSKRIIARGGNKFVVPSQTDGTGAYIVDAGDTPSCTCLDFEVRAEKCKHQWAVEYARRSQTLPDGTKTVVETLRVTYSQNWPAYSAAQQHEEQRAAELLRELCDQIPAAPYAGNGRPQTPLGAMVYAMVRKVYGGMSSRRAQSDLRAATNEGHLDKTPHFNTLIKYMDDARLTPVLERLVTLTALPLKSVEESFAIDSTGFSSSTYSRWYDKRWGKETRRVNWIKAHAMIGTVTNVVTAVKVTGFAGEGSHDALQFPGLLDTTADEFNVREVSADLAYSSKKILNRVIEKGATPYVPFKSIVTAETVVGGRDKSSRNVADPIWARMWHYFQFNRREFLKHYNQRSNAEATFSALKRKFGGAVRSKLPVAMENEVLCKFIAYNLAVLVHAIFELGIEPTFWPTETGAA